MQKRLWRSKQSDDVGYRWYGPIVYQKISAEGKLPNIEKFLKRGTTTKDLGMMGVLPAYTPPSWCTLATGAWPGTHGITDFWNHKSGDPLNKLSLGFNSNLCKVDYAWDTFAAAGKKLSYSAGLLPGRQKAPKILLWIDGSGVHPFLAGKVDFEKIIECTEGDFPAQFMTMITMTAVMNALLPKKCRI